MYLTNGFFKSLIERAVRAALASGLVTLSAQLPSTNFTTASIRSLTIAVGTAMISAIFTAFSTIIGDPNSGSFIKDAPSL